MNRITINGKTITCSGNSVVINGDNIIVDGKIIQNCTGDIRVVIDGNVDKIECAGSVEVHGDAGNIDCGGSCEIAGAVNGDVDAGGSVRCRRQEIEKCQTCMYI